MRHIAALVVTLCFALALGPACRPAQDNPLTDASPPDAGADAAPLDGHVDGSIDAPSDGPPVPDGIAEVRAAANGAGLSLAVRGATVTYLKPQVGSLSNDPAGFTVQGARLGPAVFVAVDPELLTPVPAVGDVVDFTVTTKGTINGQPRALAIAGFTRRGSADVGALVQDLSAATDVVTAIDSYDSELVTVAGTLTGALSAAGTGFQRATVDTAGITGNSNLQLRTPAVLVDAIDMVQGCRFTATRVPIARFGGGSAQAQIGAFAASDLALSGCPAPRLVGAIALSTTSVRLSFSRHIDPRSVLASGAQFTFDNGLTATAAVVNGRTITVNTGVQNDLLVYVARVASTVTDLQGSPVASADTALFGGFLLRAQVRINELNANIADGCDLIELRVITDGNLTGFRLAERTGDTGGDELSFAFPSFQVRRNDLIVVHLNAASATCNPGGASQETATPTDQPASAFPRNFDGAFDFWAADAGLFATSNVIALFDASSNIVDAVFLDDPDSAVAVAFGTRAAAGTVGAANHWAPAQPTYTEAQFRAAAVGDLDATGTSVGGASIQRRDDTDDNDRGDWTTGAGPLSTWAALNADQHPLGTTGDDGARLSVHTTLGIPSPTSTSNPASFLLVKTGYVLSYNSNRKVPNWVSWQLNTSYLGGASRQDDYRADDTLPGTLPQAQLPDYAGSGYDRGHMCPSADRTLTVAANSQTFLLTNMIPQAANNNQGPWNNLENESRNIVRAGKELFVISGGTFSAGSNTVGNGVVVPDQTFKVIVVLDAIGQGAGAVTASTRVIAVLMPNENAQISRDADWRTFRISVDTIEAMTGYDFLSDVDPAIQAIVESRVDNQ